MTESTAVTPEGRITPQDTGIWNDEQSLVWSRLVSFAHELGVPMGIQLGHAGRKASTWRTWSEVQGSVPQSLGGWPTLGASATPFNGFDPPAVLDVSGINRIVTAFADAARRSAESGFDVVEVHAAHGYLLHQFLSPLSNHRTDEWGGSWANRTRLTRRVVQAIRQVWPQGRPLFVRLSATDWVEGGWTVDDSVALSVELKNDGVDLVDCSSGGLVHDAVIPVAPGYQVDFARRIRDEASVPVVAVGRITTPDQAEEILVSGSADAIMMGRAFLRDPRWTHNAAIHFGETGVVPWPSPYHTAAPRQEV
jgi:2,4-dienoyl-CoA reductase-like NADH-dependent reductase (Old Yellow Enzyme family)